MPSALLTPLQHVEPHRVCQPERLGFIVLQRAHDGNGLVQFVLQGVLGVLRVVGACAATGCVLEVTRDNASSFDDSF